MPWARILLVLFVMVARVEARPVRLQWDYDGLRLPSSFVLETCLFFEETGCLWRTAQRLRASQRQALVQISKGQTKCFQLWAVRGEEKVGPSNTLCVP